MPNIRKPANVHKLEGTFRSDRHGNEIKIAEPIPEAPGFLTSIAVKEWDRVVALLQKYDILKATDFVCLSAYCQLFGELATEGAEMKAARIALLRGFCNDLGLTPVSRMRFDVKDSGAKEVNDFDNI